MVENATLEAGESRALEARDSYGSHSGGGGYGSYCPEGVPVELALLSVLGTLLYLSRLACMYMHYTEQNIIFLSFV